jgi:hypothetical protein
MNKNNNILLPESLRTALDAPWTFIPEFDHNRKEVRSANKSDRADRASAMAAALRWASTEMENNLPYIASGHVENAIAALDAEANNDE